MTEDIEMVFYDEETAFWMDIKAQAENHSKKIIPEQQKALEKEIRLNEAIAEIADLKLSKLKGGNKDEL